MTHTGPDGRIWHAGSLERCRQMLLTVLLACAALLGGIAPRVASAQTAPPPSPILGSGDYISTDTGETIATWEEYAGGMLLIWKPHHVYRAYAGSCGAGGPAVCYTWIDYFFNTADPYDSTQWLPFQRGCMVLGADPLTVGEADGAARITDTVGGPSAWVQTLSVVSGEGTLNPQATGVAPAPPPGSWAPASYDQCFGGVTTAAGPSACTQYMISGTWQTSESNNYHLTFTFTQSGTALTGTASFSDEEGARAGYGGAISGPLSGTLIGNRLDFVVTMPPKLDGTLSLGHYTGTVSDGQVSGSLRDDAVPNGPTFTWSGSGPTSCAGAATGPSASGGTSSGASCSWTGTWATQNDPDLVLTQTDSQVTGSFGYHGTVQGTVAGDVLTGMVTDASGASQTLELHMSASIDLFSFQIRPAEPACAVMAGLLGGVLPRNFERH
jgi:hypothetical protein